MWKSNGLSAIPALAGSFTSFLWWSVTLGTVERVMDMRARWVKINLWLHGLATGGFSKAQAEMAGLLQ